MAGALGVVVFVQRRALGVGQAVQPQPVVRAPVEHGHARLGHRGDQRGARGCPFAVLDRCLRGPLELHLALLRGCDQGFDGLGLILEVGDDGAPLQRQGRAVLVLVPLARDAVGLVVVLGSGDEHRHQGLRGLDRGQRAAVAVAHADLSVLGAHGHDRLDHAVVLDGGEEVLVQLCLADVQVDQQSGRVQQFERRFDGRHE